MTERWKFYLILFIGQMPNSATAGSVRTNPKEREKEKRREKKKKRGSKGQRVKAPIPTKGSDALIGVEEHNVKKKKEIETNRERWKTATE